MPSPKSAYFKGPNPDADDCWRGGEGGLKTTEIGWRNMWTAPYYSKRKHIGECNLHVEFCPHMNLLHNINSFESKIIWICHMAIAVSLRSVV